MSRDSCPKRPLALAIGGVFAVTVAAAPVANSAENPFGMTELNGGYLQLAQEGRCGEGKCGGSAPMPEGRCGEGKCGGSTPMADGKGGGSAPMPEGRCGEGKCGGSVPMAEGKCGEGRCGEGKCGGNR